MQGFLSYLSYLWNLEKHNGGKEVLNSSFEGGATKMVRVYKFITQELTPSRYHEGCSHYVMMLLEKLLLLCTLKVFIGYLFSLYYYCFTCFISIHIYINRYTL